MYFRVFVFMLFAFALSCQNTSDKKEFMVEEFYSYSKPFDFSFSDSFDYTKHDNSIFCTILFDEFSIENKIVRCELTYFKRQLMGVNFIIEPKDYDFFKKRYSNQKLSQNIGFRISDGDCSINPGMPTVVADKYCFQWGDKRLDEDLFEYYPDGNIKEESPIKRLFYDLIY